MFKPLKQTLRSILPGMAVMMLCAPAMAQHTGEAENDPQLKIYRATATRVNDLVHTKLDVRFDYAKRYLYGKAWITLKPHFYSTDSLTLDAKGMDIRQVALFKGGKLTPLQYKYDSLQVHIQLNKTYASTESYTVYLDYTARPEEVRVQGSAAINDAKGLYFINPDGKDPNKPVQIWTQGETEASSVWFPTIDKTNQRTTQEISMTVQQQYVTLSNGKLVSQKKNADGTRTDTWKMDLPHAPYLFMMAVGDYAVIKDQWKGKEVSYYVEKPYAQHAKAIFGNTPEMLTFYSRLLDYEYPWVKYAQVTARDYVSGAMENTTATLHGDFVQKTDRELLDNNHEDEAVIAHELFHHWFGDLVTCESWSNLTLNESFADYSEYLWFEHKYGRDAADEHGYNAMKSYMQFAEYAGDRDLVRYHYHNKEDMFDAVSYQKGGRILHMLRYAVGDEAFFRALNLYLKNNAFKSTEAHQLRLAFEEVTGRDMNWFFNQWYFGQGYPVLDIRYQYNEAARTVSVIIQQKQEGDKLYQLPMAIDIYAGGKKQRHLVTAANRTDTFTFAYTTKPDLVNVDAEKVLLGAKEDQRDISTYIYQYAHAPLYLDRREAVEACLKVQGSNEAARKVVIAALKDKFYGLRTLAINGLQLGDDDVKNAAGGILQQLAKTDENATVRAAALKKLGELKDPQFAPLFEAAIKDRSYGAAGAALVALSRLDPDKAYALAKQLQAGSRGALNSSIAAVYALKGNESDVAFFAKAFDEAAGQEKFEAAMQYLGMLANIDNTPVVEKGIDQIRAMANQFKNEMVNSYLVQMLQPIARRKQEKASLASPDRKAELTRQGDYILKLANDLKEK